MFEGEQAGKTGIGMLRGLLEPFIAFINYNSTFLTASTSSSLGSQGCITAQQLWAVGQGSGSELNINLEMGSAALKGCAE